MLFISSGEAFHNRQDDSHTLTHAAALYHLELLLITQNEAGSMDNMTERRGGEKERKRGERRERGKGRERERKKGDRSVRQCTFRTPPPNHITKVINCQLL